MTRTAEMKPTAGEWKRVGTEVWAGSKRICFGRGAYDERDAAARNANLDLAAAGPAMRDALIQARGALLLDHMVDDDGQPFGTTKVALDAIDTALAKARGETV